MTDNRLTVPDQPNALTETSDFDLLVIFTLATVSPTSARVYGQTLRKWAAWCATNDLEATAFTPGNVLAFLGREATTKATRQRQLSAFANWRKWLLCCNRMMNAPAACTKP